MRIRLALCALVALVSAATRAVADEPVSAPPPPASPPTAAAPAEPPVEAPVEAPPSDAVLRGRVFERGSVNPIVGATVFVGEVARATTDGKGRFELALPAGEHAVVVLADDHDSLHATERVASGQGLSVEYRLTPKDEKKRFRSKVRGDSRHEGERFSLRDEELHMAPGSLGDPFRVIGMLPGVAAPVPLLPLWVVRGSSPGTNGFFLDGMRVPQLFHFLLGGGIINARTIDRVDFYPSAYDASFGRFAGGIVDGETRPARDGYHAELELKLYDVGALVEATLPKGVKLTLAGHYGWPAFIVKLFDPRVDLAYWDFQLRLDWKGLTVQAIGSFDALSFSREQQGPNNTKITVDDRFRLAFYRVQIRDRERWGRVELETAVVGGIDELASFGGTGVRKLSLAFRANLSARWKRFRLLAGAEAELQRFSSQNFSPELAASEPDQLGDFAGNRGGVVGGAFVEGVIDIIPQRLTATVGVRADVYHAGSVTLVGLDPRLQVRARLLPKLTVHGGTGIYQQAPSFPIGLPGIDTFALQLGLQRSWQSAVGIEAQLPKAFEVSLTGYYQRFSNLNDVVLDFTAALCTSPPPESLSGFPARVTRQLNGAAYGMEVLVRRKVGRVTGWLAYTLSRSERNFSCGLRPSDFDQRHIFNGVLQVRLPRKVMLGAHLYVATGRPYTTVGDDGLAAVRNNSRLPDFVQLDVRVDREWLFKKWAFALFVEILNLTYSQSVFGIYTPEDSNGIPLLNQSTLNGFRWILPTVGIRGRI